MNTRTPNLLLSSLMAGLLMATTVSAYEGHKGKHDGADRPDSISRDAFLEKRGARFDKMDGNGDGIVTTEEVDTAMAERAERWARKGQQHLARMGADDNGQLSRDVAMAKAAAHFDALDTDGNSELSRDEMKAHKAAMKAKRAEWRALGKEGKRHDADREG